MVDQSKRRTIKFISGIGAASIGGVALAGTTSTALTAEVKSNASNSIDSGLFSDHLKIQIITGRTSPEDTVIFINDTDQNIVVREFLPRFVAFENQMMDLNAICEAEELVIKPQYPVASKLALWENLDLLPTTSYLWADNTAMALKTPHTSVITINTVVLDGRALLTLDKQQPISVLSTLSTLSTLS